MRDFLQLPASAFSAMNRLPVTSVWTVESEISVCPGSDAALRDVMAMEIRSRTITSVFIRAFRGLTRPKISCGEPEVTFHGAGAWMAETQRVNGKLARRQLHRLVRC